MSESTRTIKVSALSRVEGEGGLFVQMHGTEVQRVELRIYEPPRFFEAFLRGRNFHEVADIVARICGICPVAYQMSAVHAMERAWGVTITPEVRRLRRLLYCGEWIESHGLHMHLLHAPDFLGCGSGLQAAERFPDETRRGLKLKKHGNDLLAILGGRAIHPINVAIGGFHRLPRCEELQSLIPHFEWGLRAAIEATHWVASFDFPDFDMDYQFVSLVHEAEYPMNEGVIASSTGERWPVDRYEDAFVESHVPHSTALHSSLSRPNGPPAIEPAQSANRSRYCVGPIARINLNFERLSEAARRTADAVGWTSPCYNPFRGIIARGLELIHAYEEALSILREYDRPAHRSAPVQIASGEGCAATEAPRGTLYIRIASDQHGQVAFAKIVPPTSQNQSQIEHDLAVWLPRVMTQSDDAVARSCEKVIRNYDPCISCSTHFLRITWERT